MHCEDYLLENIFNFNYLGSDFQADGDHKNAAMVRLGLAKSVFGNMIKIWKSDLAQPAKLNLFGAAVVSVMTHGFESWCLDDSLLSTLRGWNARCLAHITGNSISDKCRQPTFDLVATLKLVQKTEVGDARAGTTHTARRKTDYETLLSCLPCLPAPPSTIIYCCQ